MSANGHDCPTLVIAGDALCDVYVHGGRSACQDGCWKFVEEGRVEVAGGAANAARSLAHAACNVVEFNGGISEDKIRFIEDGRIVWRHDAKYPGNPPGGRSPAEFLAYLEHHPFSAVYISDYAKGYLTDDGFRQAIAICRDRRTPIVIDPKRHPSYCDGAVLKCNEEYAFRNRVSEHLPGYVITRGALPPLVSASGEAEYAPWSSSPGPCVNHVGAGDCFGAWLTLGLAEGMDLPSASCYAHAAARVYVRHPHNRPPWLHEVWRELDPVSGKVLARNDLASLRQSTASRIVFANGVFRVPHAGHSWLLSWAKQQGDLLVVGVNDDISAFRQRPGQFCLPLESRLQTLCSHQSVDYVVPFSEDTPVQVMSLLGADVLVKGAEYEGEVVPGAELVKELRFPPPSPFPSHAADLIRAIRA